MKRPVLFAFAILMIRLEVLLEQVLDDYRHIKVDNNINGAKLLIQCMTWIKVQFQKQMVV